MHPLSLSMTFSYKIIAILYIEIMILCYIYFYFFHQIFIYFSAFNIDKKLEIEDNQTKSAQTVITLANEILDIIKEDDILLLVGTKYDAR